MKLVSGIEGLLIIDSYSVNKKLISNNELTLEQLQQKQTILEDPDVKIAPLIGNKEEEIMEADDTKIKILHGITHLNSKLNSIETESTQPPPVPTEEYPHSFILTTESTPPQVV